jgi:hypothetical protein
MSVHAPSSSQPSQKRDVAQRVGRQAEGQRETGERRNDEEEPPLEDDVAKGAQELRALDVGVLVAIALQEESEDGQRE